YARQGILERFASRQFLRVNTGIARVEARMLWVLLAQRRWRNIVAAPPDLDLRLAVALGGLPLVQPLQGSVVAFVETPTALDWKPQQIELIEHDPLRADRALEH